MEWSEAKGRVFERGKRMSKCMYHTALTKSLWNASEDASIHGKGCLWSLAPIVTDYEAAD